jgi:hypothetical protein
MANENDQFQDLPDGLVEELGGLYRQSVPVPVERDRVILAGARAQMAKRRRLRLVMRLSGAAAAVAAVVALVMRTPEIPDAEKQVRPAVAVKAQDVNRDGVVNIVDALLLARKVEAGGVAQTQWDFDGDGVVDRKDADSIANEVVSLGGAVR